MATSGNISVTYGAKFEQYAINGQMVTIKDAVTRFFGSDPFKDKVVHVNGTETSDLAAPLRTNDVILVLNKALASGGYKQAAS